MICIWKKDAEERCECLALPLLNAWEGSEDALQRQGRHFLLVEFGGDWGGGMTVRLLFLLVSFELLVSNCCLTCMLPLAGQIADRFAQPLQYKIPSQIEPPRQDVKCSFFENILLAVKKTTKEKD